MKQYVVFGFFGVCMVGLLVLIGCSLIPKPVSLDSIQLSESELVMVEGGKEFITIMPNPSDGSLKSLSWVIEDPNIVTVTGGAEYLTVKAVSQGKTQVLFEAGSVTTALQVQVTSKQAPYLVPSQSALFIDPGQIANMSVKVMNAWAAPHDFVWHSYDSKVLQVVGQGAQVALKGHAPGEAILECTVPDLGLHTTVAVVVGKYQLSTTYLSLNKGSEVLLTIEGEGQAIHGFDWVCADTGVASFLGSGSTAVITGVSPGLTTIQAVHNELNITLECVVRVVGSEPSLYFSPAGYVVNQGQSLSLRVLVDQLNPKEVSAITWKSSSPVATIIGTGQKAIVEAIGVGSVTITATYPPLGLSASAEVMVKQPEYYLSISDTLLSIDSGNTTQISVRTNANPSSVQWAVEDSEIVSLTANRERATLLAQESGVTMVVASLPDGSTAKCKVRVIGDSVSLYFSPAGFVIDQDQSLSLRVLADGLTNQEMSEIVWQSNSEAVSLVGAGKQVLVEAVAVGTAIITATHAGLGVSGSAEIVVKKPEYFIAISKTQLTLEVGSMADLSVQTDGDLSDVTWDVEHGSILNLTSNRNNASILALRTGITRVVASLPDGSTARCEVTVRQKPSLSLNFSNHQIKPNQQVTLRAQHNQPGSAVTWLLTDPDIGILDNNFGDAVRFTAKKEGSTDVKVTLTVGREQYHATGKITVLHGNMKISLKNAHIDGKVSWVENNTRLKMSGKSSITLEVVPSVAGADLGKVEWVANLDGFGIFTEEKNGHQATIHKKSSSPFAIEKNITIYVPKYNISYKFKVSNDGIFN